MKAPGSMTQSNNTAIKLLYIFYNCNKNKKGRRRNCDELFSDKRQLARYARRIRSIIIIY